MSEHRLDRIVIERPRSGMRISSQKRSIRRQIKQKLQQVKYDYQTAEIGSLKPCYKEASRGIKSKCFSDHLHPLYQWLQSKVGQPWNDVYAELSQRLEFNTLSGQHILLHVWDFVVRDVVLINNLPHTYKYSLRKLGIWSRREELYIHPETGILCAVKLEKKPKPKPKPDYLWCDQYHQYCKLDDIWYFVSFRQLPQPTADSKGKLTGVRVRDVLQQKTLLYPSSSSRNSLYAYHKRQCNKKEISWIEEQIGLQSQLK